MTSCVAQSSITTGNTNNASIFATCTSTVSNASSGLILPPPSTSHTRSRSQPASASAAVPGPQVAVPSALFQQQFPQAISSKQQSTTVQQQHQVQVQAHDQRNNVYNGIFLVDGLGSGVRIDTTKRPAAANMSNNESNPGLTPVPVPAQVHHHQYGLPAVHSSPTRQSQSHSSGSGPMTSANPLCIRIDSSGNNLSGFSANTSELNSNRFGGGGVTLPATSSAGGVVIPLPGNNGTNTSTSPTASSLLKHNRNSVTLSVPSPPLESNIPSSSGSGSAFAVVTPQSQSQSQSGSQGNSSQSSCSTAAAANLCRSPTFPGTSRQEMTRTNITVVPNATAPGTNSSPTRTRTLISTEAQTEDCPQLSTGLAPPASASTPLVPPPPPPSRGCREQRKRERRERRRDRNGGHHHYMSHSSSSAIARNHMSSSTPSGHGHGHSSRHRSSSASCVGRQSHNPDTMGAGSADNLREPGSSAPYDGNHSASIPDLLLNSQMPPPYSTLPQQSERRLAVTPSVPLSPHNMIGLPMSPVHGNAHGPTSTAPVTTQPGPVPQVQTPAQQYQHQQPQPQQPHPQPHQQFGQGHHAMGMGLGMLPQLQMLHTGHPQGAGVAGHCGVGGAGAQAPPPQFLVPAPPGSVCHLSPTGAQPVRYHFAAPAPPNSSRTTRRSLRAPRGVPRMYASEEEPKSCCGMSTSQAVSIRWFIIIIAVIGICCTVAGTALGAARSAGSQHLTLSLLMIGVGVVLLTVSAVAWRLTANESGTSCRAMLGFGRAGSSRGDGGAEPNRRFVPRLAPSYGRPHHPYAAMMYPDFQYRPPPPSYNQSMQEYRLRLLLLERSNPSGASAATLSSPSALSMVPPPPAYRPYNGTLRPCGNYRLDPDYSRPPSYRSRSSAYSGYDIPVTNRPCLDPGLHQQHLAHHHQHLMESPMHSRDPSLLSYLSQHSIVGDNVSIVSGSVTGSHHHHRHHPNSQSVVTVMQAVTVGMDLGLDMSGINYDHSGCRVEEVNVGDEDKLEYHGHSSNPDDVEGDEKKIQKVGRNENHGSITPTSSANEKTGSLNKDGNLVRIVQTTNSSQVIDRRDTVIVTVSGSPHHNNNTLWEHHQHQALVHQSPPPPPTQQSVVPNYNSSNNINSTNNNLNQHHRHSQQQSPHQTYHHQNNNIQTLVNSSSSQSQISSTSTTSDNNEVQILAHL